MDLIEFIEIEIRGDQGIVVEIMLSFKGFKIGWYEKDLLGSHIFGFFIDKNLFDDLTVDVGSHMRDHVLENIFSLHLLQNQLDKQILSDHPFFILSNEMV